MSIRTEFESKVEALLAIKEILPYETRYAQVEELTEWYYSKTGKKYNNSYFLDLLGTYLLADTLRSKSTHKVKHESYPVLSRSQQKLRNRRESRVGDANLDFVRLKEIFNHPNAYKKNTTNKEE